MGYLNPTEVRLSDNLLLSDFMGCDAIYRYGYRNRFDANNKEHLKQGKKLAETLTALGEKYGPFSISYGFISPELSNKIIKYQDPDKPSYHRWDMGAAADVCFRDWVKKDAPIKLAYKIAEEFDFSRMITYSESPFICFGTDINPSRSNRRVFYENRYVGNRKGKPLFITKSKNINVLKKELKTLKLEHGWQGGGYPSYHGGGIKQAQHKFIGKYVSLLNVFYCQADIHKGVKHSFEFMISTIDKSCVMFSYGRIIDSVIEKIKDRVSIVNSNLLNAGKSSFVFDFVLPVDQDPQDMAHFLSSNPEVKTVIIAGGRKYQTRIRVEVK